MTPQEIIESIQKIDSKEEVKKIWSELVKHYRSLDKEYFAKIEKQCGEAGKEFWEKVKKVL